MNTKLKSKADMIALSIKRAAKRWRVSPHDVLQLRSSNHRHSAYQARRDVVLELYSLGYSKAQIAKIFQYRSVHPISCLLTNYKYSTSK
jgi:Holliday junction resolvasome RuvABC DNA-binding subunit